MTFAYLPNAKLTYLYDPESGKPRVTPPVLAKNPATAGAGKVLISEELPVNSASSDAEKVDSPAGYIDLVEKKSGRVIDTYNCNIDLLPQTVTFDDREFDLEWRFERGYKSYEVTLKDVRFDKYVGTKDKAKVQ